jgi:hypothetical protein
MDGVAQSSDGSPSIEWVLHQSRGFVAGALPAPEFCALLDPMIDWAERLTDDDPHRHLLYTYAYSLVGICLPLGDGDITLEEARRSISEWIPYLEAGPDAWTELVEHGDWPF